MTRVIHKGQVGPNDMNGAGEDKGIDGIALCDSGENLGSETSAEDPTGMRDHAGKNR